MCNGLFLYNSIERFTSLRVIQLTSAGLDRVPLDDIRARGIALHNAAGVYSVPMAEFAVCGILQLYKQSRFFTTNQAQHKWQQHAACQRLHLYRHLLARGALTVHGGNDGPTAICCPQTDRFCAAINKVGLCSLGQLAVLKVLAVFVQHQQFCNDPAADCAIR